MVKYFLRLLYLRALQNSLSFDVVHNFSISLQLVKDIRHLVDNGEFLVTRHCPSPECRLVVTVLLELITDYSVNSCSHFSTAQ